MIFNFKRQAAPISLFLVLFAVFFSSLAFADIAPAFNSKLNKIITVYEAAQQGRIDLVTDFLEKDINPDTTDEYRNTVLRYITTYAINHNKHEIMQPMLEKLLEKGANLNADDVNGDTALMIATYYNDLKIMRLLLEKGANPNTANTRDGCSALIIAVYKNNIESVRLLLEKNANIDMADKNGNTALIVSTYKNNPEIVQLLLKKVANSNLVNRDGYTALMVAKSFGSDAKIVNLLQKAADKSQKNEI